MQRWHGESIASCLATSWRWIGNTSSVHRSDRVSKNWIPMAIPFHTTTALRWFHSSRMRIVCVCERWHSIYSIWKWQFIVANMEWVHISDKTVTLWISCENIVMKSNVTCVFHWLILFLQFDSVFILLARLICTYKMINKQSVPPP